MVQSLLSDDVSPYSIAVYRMCGSKTRYPDLKTVRSMMNQMARTRGRHGRPEFLRAYHCPNCNGWHLTRKHPEDDPRNSWENTAWWAVSMISPKGRGADSVRR